jgi:hypothetical protein
MNMKKVMMMNLASVGLLMAADWSDFHQETLEAQEESNRAIIKKDRIESLRDMDNSMRQEIMSMPVLKTAEVSGKPARAVPDPAPDSSCSDSIDPLSLNPATERMLNKIP